MWWQVTESLNDDGTDWEEKSSGSINIGGLAYGQSNTFKIEYYDDNKFTFTVEGESVSFTGPTRQGPEKISYKGLETIVEAYEDTGNGFVSASFDNVYINNQATVYDDFSIAPLEEANWLSLEVVRELENGKLQLSTHSNGAKENTRINFSKPYNYTEGTVTIKSESTISTNAKGRTRISGEFFNDTYGPGKYNGYEGDIYAQIYIDHYDDGTLEANCYVEKATNADWSTYQELYFHSFSIPIDFDKPYKLSIHFRGTSFVFKVIDISTSTEESYEYQVTSDVNLASHPNVEIISRVYGNDSSGYMSVEWDDIYVDTEVAPATYDATGEWNITTSNEWADGTCSIPVNSPSTGNITQNSNDVTLVVGGNETLIGYVFSNKYYLTQTLIDPDDIEVFYVRLNLSSATAGSGSVVIEDIEGNDVCYKGFDIVFTKTADVPADVPASGGGGGGCFISTMLK